MADMIRYKDSYSALRLELPVHLDALAFSNLLIQCAPELPLSSIRHLPNGFAPENIVTTYPLPVAWRWTWLENCLRDALAPGVVVRLPLIFQLEPLVFHACRGSNTFLFLNDKANMPVARAALAEEAFGSVLTTADDAAGLTTYLTHHGFSKPLTWITIAPLAPLQRIDLGPHRLIQSLHLIPGLSVFEECEKFPNTFHLASQLEMEEMDGHRYVSGYLDNPLPLWRFRIPFALEIRSCTCGRTGYDLPYA